MAQEIEQEQWVRVEKVEIPGCRVFVSPDSLVLLPETEREEVWARSVRERSGPAVLWLEALEVVFKSYVLKESPTMRVGQ
ncbi:excinuclease ABC, A subunit [Alicyclobacillus hesperidum URH17-3-68]|uniref:hypothetical protein n=1 Tax=Alicyclobacillus hesperidum TaxID=89784 RepID=UPI000281C121|nr:hypothetical protein [Alicyclobacillus hesperidum]EJY56259.1 excinuclease ABC, A subunit [Alicyclobacillus hesperidum URH17-3-68]